MRQNTSTRHNTTTTNEEQGPHKAFAMADPTGQPVQPGERRGMSVPQRLMIMAIVYLFIKRYVGDGSVQKPGRPTAPAESEVPVAPLVKEVLVPDPTVARPRPVHGGFVDPDDEFAGFGVSAAFDHVDAYPVEMEKEIPLPVDDALLVHTVTHAGAGSRTDSRAGAGAVPQVLVQFCVS